MNDTIETYADFEALVAKTFQPEPYGIRFGQHWFNMLYSVRPNIAKVIRNSRLDPFYSETVSTDAQVFVAELW